MFAFVVIWRQLSSFDGQKTAEQQQRAVEGQNSVQESRSDAVALIRDAFGGRFEIHHDVLQVREENEPEQHHRGLDADENGNGLEERGVADLQRRNRD